MVTSITGATPLTFEALVLVCSETRVHNLSVLIVGQKWWFLCKWKCLIPNLPKWPGWLNNYKLKRYKRYLLFVHHDSFVVHTSGSSSTTWMLSVLSNSTMTHWHMTSHMSCLFQSCDLNFWKKLEFFIYQIEENLLMCVILTIS